MNNTTLNRKGILWMLNVPGEKQRYITARWHMTHKRPMSRYSTKQLQAILASFNKQRDAAYKAYAI